MRVRILLLPRVRIQRLTWTRAIDPKATKSDSLKQQQLNKELWKERTNEVQKYIARWAYTHGKLLVYYVVFTFQSSLDVVFLY